LHERSVDLFSSMGQLRQMQGVMHLSLLGLLDTDQGDPGGPAPRVEFECHALHLAILSSAILEPDGQRDHPMDYCSLAVEQQPCAPL